MPKAGRKTPVNSLPLGQQLQLMLTIGMEDHLYQFRNQRRLSRMNRRDNGKPGLHQPPLFRQIAELQLNQPMAVLA